MLKKLDNTKIEIAKNMHYVFQTSYAVEAGLLEAVNFPPLQRTIENFAVCKNDFFGYFKETNHIGISSVGFEKAAIFLRNRDFRVVELLGIKDNEEVNLLYEDEEPLWITKDHHLEIYSLLSNNDYTLFTHVKIELADGGDINYSAASLYVKFPDGEDIKSKTIMLLQTMGYYAAEKIFDFCSKNPDMHLLEFVLGMEPEDITDEFERMKAHTENINNEDYS